MITYKQLHSTLNKDGQKFLVDVYQWADQTLTGDQLAQWQLDRPIILEFYQNLIDSGTLTVAPITYSVPTPAGSIDVVIGNLATFTTVESTSPEYDYWQTQFAADPTVEYQPPILQE